MTRAVVNFRPSYLRYADEVISAVTDVLRSGSVLQGACVRDCEDKITELTGKRFAVLFSSATTAIESVMSYRDGDVVTPTVNFVAVPYVARKLGRAVRLRPRSWPLSGPMLDDGRSAARSGAQRWHVALAGQASAEYARSVGPDDIEDASQCFMTRTARGMVGALGLAGVYSFTFNKFMTAGEGGCVVTDDAGLGDHLRRYRDFGRLGRPGEPAARPIDGVGFNYRLSEIGAAMLRVQLDHAWETLACMRDLHERYVRALAAAGAEAVTCDGDNYTRVIVRAACVARIRRTLAEDHGIATPTPVMDYSMAEGAGFDGPAEEGWDEMLCLPFWHGLTDADITYVAQCTARAAGRRKDGRDRP